MNRIALLAVLLVALSSAAQCFDYAAEQLGSLDKVKQEFGAQPLEAIKHALTDGRTDASRFRRAVAATAFLGADGADLLAGNVSASIKDGNYIRASEMLDSLGRIADRRAVHASLSILDSAAPLSAKLAAAAVIGKQVQAASWSVQGPYSVASGQECMLSGITTRSVASSFSSGEIYSHGTTFTRDEALVTLQHLLSLIPTIGVDDTQLRDAVQRALRAIDEKELKYQELVREVQSTSSDR